ncbi:MAG: sugar phosphate isomerase/epimerase [Lentisphaerae bacterium]|nr:sugar phosphate isomerase/epimerase [Lentisphaerota bacterium]
MKLKLACADFAFPLLSHDHALDLIAMLGVEGVDIGLFPNRSHFQAEDYLADPSGAARELSSKVRDRGLDFGDIFHQSGADLQSLAENHPDTEERRRSRDAFMRALEFTTLCQARHMTTLPGIHWENESHDDSFQRCCDELAWRVEQAARTNVVYSVEPHMWSVAPTPPMAQRLVDRTPGLTLTLDYGHYTAQGAADPEIEGLWESASHFHARCAAKDKLQTSLARNTIDWPGVVAAAQRTRYDGYFGLEYVIMDAEIIDDVDNLSQTILLRDALLSCNQGQR